MKKVEVKKNRRKKFIFFLSVERPLYINIFSCNFIRSLGIGKRDKIEGESSENAKRDFSIFKFLERLLNIFCQAKILREVHYLTKRNKIFK